MLQNKIKVWVDDLKLGMYVSQLDRPWVETPFLFQKGMGAELQQPLALAIIGGMFLGTLVSLYFIPLMYYWLKK